MDVYTSNVVIVWFSWKITYFLSSFHYWVILLISLPIRLLSSFLPYLLTSAPLTSLIGVKTCMKSVILKSDVLCLPRYFRYSIEAKRVKFSRTGGNKSINSMFTCVLTVLLCFKESKRKENKEWKEKSTVETTIETLKKGFFCFWYILK